MLTLPVSGRPQETCMIPFNVEKKPAAASSGPTGAKQEPGQIEQTKKFKVEQKEDAAKEAEAEAAPLELKEIQLVEAKSKPSAPLSQLTGLQQQLREAIKRRGRPSTSGKEGTEAKVEIAELLLKIQKIQEQ